MGEAKSGAVFPGNTSPVLTLRADCRLQKNLADSYRKVGHTEKMSDVSWQASSHDLVETSDDQRNPVVFAARMALRAGLPHVANLSVGIGHTIG